MLEFGLYRRFQNRTTRLPYSNTIHIHIWCSHAQRSVPSGIPLSSEWRIFGIPWQRPHLCRFLWWCQYPATTIGLGPVDRELRRYVGLSLCPCSILLQLDVKANLGEIEKKKRKKENKRSLDAHLNGFHICLSMRSILVEPNVGGVRTGRSTLLKEYKTLKACWIKFKLV